MTGDRTVDELRPDDVAEAARVARAVLAEIGDDESELTGTAATRNRLEGAAMALEAVSGEQRAGSQPPR